jgi:cytohesin
MQLKLGLDLQLPIAKPNLSVLFSRFPRLPIYDVHWSAWNGTLNPLSNLLNYRTIGLNQYWHGSVEFSPLHLAVCNMHHEAANFLLSNAITGLEFQTQPDWSPLHLAVSNNDVRMIVLLLHAGVDIESFNERGYTPMQWAAGLGLVGAIMALQRAGGDVKSEGRPIQPGELVYERGRTPMHLAAFNGHVEAIKALKQLGVDVSIKSKGGWTPMHAAAENGQCDAIAVLKELGADVGPLTDSGMTPLQIAKDQGQDKAVEMLIEAGAQF